MKGRTNALQRRAGKAPRPTGPAARSAAIDLRWPVKLRPGVPADVPALDRIALAAKAHWGYTAAQLALWQEDLAVAVATWPVRPVCVAEDAGAVVGFAQVATDVEPWELWALWVQPGHMGRGVGKALLEWARRFAAEGGQSELAIDSDPHAEGFYRARGARLVGQVPAPIAGDAARVRPQLRLPTAPTAEVPRLGGVGRS